MTQGRPPTLLISAGLLAVVVFGGHLAERTSTVDKLGFDMEF